MSSPPAPWDGTPDEDGDDARDEPARQTAPTAAHTPIDEYDLASGTKLGEYQIEAKIGQGGMGVVFSAVHPLIGKRAAIKILKKELCADPHTVERFIDEARVVNQIGHPNIVDVFAFGEMPDGRSYFVMEWLKGETLRERIARGPLPLAEVCRLVRLLARALEAAHELGVIHRDLKPDNVFLVERRDEPANVKLLDFGIAKLAHSDHRVEKTATGAIVGTPQYIAPEQAKGYAIDQRADIYALGGMIFEMLTGRPPFVADNAMEMVAKHLMEMPVRASTFVPDVPPELDELVFDMLAKQPDGRPSLVRVCEVLERARTEVPAAVAAQDRSAPVVRVTEPPSADRSGPIDRPSFGGVPASPVSRPAFDAVVSQADAVPDLRRSRPLWFAIAGVPIAALLAFLIVRSFGGASDEPAPAETTPVSRVEVGAPDVAPPDVTEPAVTTPAVTKPAVTRPAVTKPAVTRPAVTRPAVTRPAVTKPEVKNAAVVRPVTPVPSAKRPEPPAKARLRLTIVGGGPNPEIKIDGAASSADAMVTPGAHTVEIKSKGMVAQRFTVEVGTGGTVRRVALVPRTAPSVPAVEDGKEILQPGQLEPITPKRRRSR